ncbi:MAG: hypothetical protein AAF801_16215 [Pseudomonadota bacterium]
MPKKITPFQRLKPQDITHDDAEIAALRAQLGNMKSSPIARSRIQSRLGSLLLTDPSTVHDGLSLLESCTELEGEDAIVLSIRHATALQYACRHAEAYDMLCRVTAACRPDMRYLDFALHHLGKCLVEMGHIARAHTCFEEAHALRTDKGDLALIASTQRALAGLPKN